MNRLTNIDEVSFDSVIIIYYCFNFKDNRLIELCDKAHRLTEYLIKYNSRIIVPSFILSEIKRKDTLQIINGYISSNQITNLPKNPNMAFKLGLDYKFKSKVNKLMKKDWVVISDYSPSDALIGQIHDFFKNLIYHPKCKDFLKKKKRKNPVPSIEDMALMAFSKEKISQLFLTMLTLLSFQRNYTTTTYLIKYTISMS